MTGLLSSPTILLSSLSKCFFHMAAASSEILREEMREREMWSHQGHQSFKDRIFSTETHTHTEIWQIFVQAPSLFVERRVCGWFLCAACPIGTWGTPAHPVDWVKHRDFLNVTVPGSYFCTSLTFKTNLYNSWQSGKWIDIQFLSCPWNSCADIEVDIVLHCILVSWKDAVNLEGKRNVIYSHLYPLK